MSQVHESLSPALRKWIEEQKIFFVASAPLSPQGHINCSPKGSDCFRLLSDSECIYADFTGSGSETAAHVLENQRICLILNALIPGNPYFPCVRVCALL